MGWQNSMDAGQGEREKKATLAASLRAMKDGSAYKAVMDRVAERCGCGKWWKGWILADESKAKVMRELARGYLAFDELVEQMIAEGDAAKKILDAPKGDDMSSSPRRGMNLGQGEIDHA